MIEKIKFVQVELPILNQTVDVLAKELKELEGKTICLDLTRDLKGKSVEAIYSIHIQGDKAVATLSRLHVFPFYIRRMMRKAIDYIEDSFESNSKDHKVRLKPFFITRKKVPRSIRNSIRVKAKEELNEYLKSKNLDEVFTDMLEGKLQRSLSLKLKKIYPLTFCDIRDLEIIKEKKAVIKE
jgi:ribosomal protein S3AE